MAKVRKKYKPKNLSLAVRAWSWESDRARDERFVSVQLKTLLGWTHAEGKEAFNAFNEARNWSLIIRVILWYPSGEVDIVPAIVNIKGVNLNQLEETSKLMRKEILKETEIEHIVDVGWYCESFGNHPRVGNSDEFEIGDITLERQDLWNKAWREEVKDIV